MANSNPNPGSNPGQQPSSPNQPNQQPNQQQPANQPNPEPVDSVTLAAQQSHTVVTRPEPLSRPCVQCGNVGSWCWLCDTVLCLGCNQNPHLGDGHAPADHLTPPEESEHDRLTRENASIQLALDRRQRSNRRVAPDLEPLRARNAELKAALGQ
jgi:hypothetical protein